MVNDRQDELCETVTKAYVYEPFEEYAKQVEVKPLRRFRLSTTGLDKSWLVENANEYDKVAEFEKYIRIPGEFKPVLKLASKLGQP